MVVTNMNWHVLRSEEARGFVSKRIRGKLLHLQMMIWGTSFVMDYGKIKKVLTPDEIFKQNI